MKNSRSTSSPPVLDVEVRHQQLEDAGARFLTISDDLLAICGFDGRMKWVNPAHERVTGFRSDELAGKPYIDFVHADDRERSMVEAGKVASTRKSSFAFEVRFRCKDGSYRNLLVTATPSVQEEVIYTVAKDVTERRQLEDESTRFIDLSLDFLCIVDFDGNWRRVNPAFEKTFGFPAHELLGRPYIELIHPDDRESVMTESQKLTTPGTETRDFRARLRSKQGSYRSVLWSAASSPEEGLIFAVGRDESDRKRSEEVLREAEERFRGAFDQAPIGMALVSIEREGAGCFLRVNNALCEITGHPQEELIGTDFHAIAHPADYDPDIHYVPWMLAGEISQYVVEKRLVHADGHLLWAQLATSLVRDGKGRPLYLISQIQDITERREAEHDLLEGRARLQAIIDNTTAVIYVKGQDGRFQLVNRRFEMLHGVRREEVPGKTYRDLFPEELAESLEADDLKVLSSGLTLELEEVVPTTEGSRTYLTTKFPLLDPTRSKRVPYAVCGIAADITERKRAEEALRASEEHFRRIVNTAHDAFIAMDAAGVITAWNPQAEETFGWSESEAIGQSLATKIIPPRYREMHFRGLEQFFETGRGALLNKRVEIEALHRDGHEFPIEITLTPLKVGGKYVFNAFLHDISERKRVEQELKHSAEQIRDLYDRAPCGYHSLDKQGIVVQINETELSWLGYRRDEVVGKMKIADILTPESRERFVEIFAREREEGSLTDVELDYVRRDGSIMSVSVSATAVRDADGKFVMSRTTIFDITERKRAEQALREVQEGFRTAFEDAPIGVALLSIEPASGGQLLQLNRSLCEITGYSTKELLSMALEEITYPADLDSERPLAEKLLAGEVTNYQIEKRYVRKDGSLVWVMHNASTVHDSSDKLLYGIAQIEDISERKQAEESLASVHAELERRAAELERSNTDLQQFAYATSHDLSEPLRMVSSYVQLLARRYEGKLDSDADEFIQFAVDGVVRMQALIDGLLMYSRAGTSEYAVGPVDCQEVAETTLGMMRTSLDEADAEVTVDPLPTIKGDETQLSQLFQNLVANAVKFVENGPPRVHVSAEREGDYWRFQVADNGIGIEPAHAERIFNVFQRLHGRGEYPGSGIGLATCKRIVERHQGKIWVESEPGSGSTFYFTIPASAASADKSEAAPENSRKAQAA
jgi:PAS domain S-box-containing protein